MMGISQMHQILCNHRASLAFLQILAVILFIINGLHKNQGVPMMHYGALMMHFGAGICTVFRCAAMDSADPSISSVTESAK
jgi:hypothetical protein